MSQPIRNWPISERPRERLLSLKATSLSIAELLAILIGEGDKGSSALDLARRVLFKDGKDSKSSLHNLSVNSLLQVQGIGPAKAARILAGLELGKRWLQEDSRLPKRIMGSSSVVEFIKPRLAGLTHEVFYLIGVDVKNRPILTEEISRGTSDGVAFLPRDAFCEAIRTKVSGMIFVHNHPSGDPTPSTEDRYLTVRLAKCASLLGLRFLDHVIVAENEFYSFADQEPKLFVT